MTDRGSPARAASGAVDDVAEGPDGFAAAGEICPASPVSVATGLVGVVAAGLVIARYLGSDTLIEFQSLVVMLALAASMAFWLLVVEKVHRRPSTGLDFTAPRPIRKVVSTTLTKLAGLYATWALMGLLYASIRTYRDPDYDFYFNLLIGFGLVVVIIGAVYVAFIDRFMRDPRDTLWHAGRWVLMRNDADPAMLREHARIWAIKGFFLALMAAGTPGQLSFVTGTTLAEILSSPVRAALWAIELMYLFDVTFALIGYLMTSRLLDAHIRSTNPYLWAWVYALICYTPFIVMGTNGPLDYRDGMVWTGWFTDHETLLALWAAALVLLTGFYAWATVIFGLRFSNLTHRGILTNGPFRYFKHPAYLSKNLFWWMVYLPFLSLDGPGTAIGNCVLLLVVNFIYFMRGRTEEWHLMEDPDYRAYSLWIAEHGVIARLRRNVLMR